ncbi:hypothetical protein Tco_1374109, partial [Tanacetum coccineum]
RGWWRRGGDSGCAAEMAAGGDVCRGSGVVEAAWLTWRRWWWFGDGDEMKTMRVVVVWCRGGVGDVVFRCGDKYGPGHRFKTGTFKVLEANEDVEESLTTDPTDLKSDREETTEISLHAILGKPHLTTMKVHGILHSTKVLILIDGGSIHNFISDVLINELNLATQPVAPFGVQIGNGDVICCGQICKNLPV